MRYNTILSNIKLSQELLVRAWLLAFMLGVSMQAQARTYHSRIETSRNVCECGPISEVPSLPHSNQQGTLVSTEITKKAVNTSDSRIKQCVGTIKQLLFKLYNAATLALKDNPITRLYDKRVRLSLFSREERKILHSPKPTVLGTFKNLIGKRQEDKTKKVHTQHGKRARLSQFSREARRILHSPESTVLDTFKNLLDKRQEDKTKKVHTFFGTLLAKMIQTSIEFVRYTKSKDLETIFTKGSFRKGSSTEDAPNQELEDLLSHITLFNKINITDLTCEELYRFIPIFADGTEYDILYSIIAYYSIRPTVGAVLEINYPEPFAFERKAKTMRNRHELNNILSNTLPTILKLVKSADKVGLLKNPEQAKILIGSTIDNYYSNLKL